MHSPTQNRDMLLSLQPQGPAWSRKTTGWKAQFFLAVGALLSRLERDEENMADEMYPSTAYQTLENWEDDFNLPDPCTHGEQNIDIRRAALMTKFKKKEVASIPYLVAYAKALGYDIEIITHRPSICGIARCGDRLGARIIPAAYCGVARCGDTIGAAGNLLAGVIGVKVLNERINLAYCGISRCGDRIGVIRPATELECRFNTAIGAGKLAIYLYQSNNQQ